MIKNNDLSFPKMKNNIEKAGNLFYQYRACRQDASTIYDIENIRHNVVFARTSSFDLASCRHSKTFFCRTFGFHFRHDNVLRLFFSLSLYRCKHHPDVSAFGKWLFFHCSVVFHYFKEFFHNFKTEF